MRIVIIGNGVAGITCALAARERDPNATITVIGGETDYFFSRTALMYAYMDRMPRRALEPLERHVWSERRIGLVRDWVVDHDAAAKTVRLQSGGSLAYDRLVIAVGASPRRFPWDGIADVRDGLVHFVSMQDLDACERLTPSTRRAVVVGGGLIGIELVECLRHHGVEVTFLVREGWYWPVALGREEADVVATHMREHGVDLRLGDELSRVEVDGDGRVSRIHTKRGAAVDAQLLGVAVGVQPNLERIRAWKDAPALGRGVIVDESFRTSLPDVFAVGDCAQIQPADGPGYVELIWYSAKRQGELLGARTLFGDDARYRRPTFFNSSKFFDIEYTTVGRVMELPEGTPTTLLEHPKRPIRVRIVHDGDAVAGFNLLGSRWDHEVLTRWVEERRTVDWVLAHLAEAQFDVEFGRADLARLQRRDLPLAKGGT